MKYNKNYPHTEAQEQDVLKGLMAIGYESLGFTEESILEFVESSNGHIGLDTLYVTHLSNSPAYKEFLIRSVSSKKSPEQIERNRIREIYLYGSEHGRQEGHKRFNIVEAFEPEKPEKRKKRKGFFEILKSLFTRKKPEKKSFREIGEERVREAFKDWKPPERTRNERKTTSCYTTKDKNNNKAL